MTAGRAAGVAMVALMLIGVIAGAGSAEQYPRGLLSRASKGCVIETRPLSFGYYDPLNPIAISALAQVIYTCGVKDEITNRGVQNIRIEMSRGYSNSYSDRHMTTADPTEHLFYNVYLDADHRTVWGDGSNGTDYYFDPRPPNKEPVVVPVFGRIAPLQDVPAGQYIDVLQVTILF